MLTPSAGDGAWLITGLGKWAGSSKEVAEINGIGLGPECAGDEEWARGEETWAIVEQISDPTDLGWEKDKTNQFESGSLEPLRLEILNNLEELSLLNIHVMEDEGYSGVVGENDTTDRTISVEPIRILKPRNCGGTSARRGKGTRIGPKIIKASDFLIKLVQRIAKQYKRRRNWQLVETNKKSGVRIVEMGDENNAEGGRGDDARNDTT